MVVEPVLPELISLGRVHKYVFQCFFVYYLIMIEITSIIINDCRNVLQSVRLSSFDTRTSEREEYAFR